MQRRGSVKSDLGFLWLSWIVRNTVMKMTRMIATLSQVVS